MSEHVKFNLSLMMKVLTDFLPTIEISTAFYSFLSSIFCLQAPGRVGRSAGHLTRKSGVLGRYPVWQHTFVSPSAFFKKGSCQLLAKVCARSTG